MYWSKQLSVCCVQSMKRPADQNSVGVVWSAVWRQKQTSQQLSLDFDLKGAKSFFACDIRFFYPNLTKTSEEREKNKLLQLQLMVDPH